MNITKIKYKYNFAILLGIVLIFSVFSIGSARSNGYDYELTYLKVYETIDPSKLQFREIAGGFTQPLFVTHAGDGSNRIFVVERAGKIRIVKNGVVQAAPFLDVQSLVNSTGGEQGLLALAFHPNYQTNGQFYVVYTDYTSPVGSIVLAGYKRSSINPDIADPSSRTTILAIPEPYTNHNGGTLAFGPDGFLYWSTGDGGSGGDPQNNAQNLNSLLGKILRLDVDSGAPYAIPASNPFYTAGPSVRKEIWSYGLRNPWRISFDRGTGDLYIGDVGQGEWEEIDWQPANSPGGENYGWRILEGAHCYDPLIGCIEPVAYAPPIAEYPHTIISHDDNGCSVTGGYVYRGSAFPSLEGLYFYGDFCLGKIYSLYSDPNTGWTNSFLIDTPFGISSFGEDEQGELYITDYYSGKIYKIQYEEITISGNTGVAGVTLSYTDGTAKTATSQADGGYSFPISYNWSGTVTPSHTCFTFTPASRTYSNVIANQTNQNYVPTFDNSSGCAEVDVYIASEWKGSYAVPSSIESINPSYLDVFDGPVQVKSTNGKPIFTSERTIYKDSFNETTGMPSNQFTSDYWFPWYDFLNMKTWINIGNPSETETAHVSVYIAGQFKGSMDILPQGRWTPYYAGVFDGPVQVKSTDVLETAGGQSSVAGIPIFASERTLYKTSFNETTGIPGNQLVAEYWFPWYDFLYMKTWINIGNPSKTETAHVSVYIAGQFKGSMDILPQGRWTPHYAGVFDGPVQVKSTDVLETAGGQSSVAGIPIIASERTLYKNSFNETTGIPWNKLAAEYWFPWYDFNTIKTWINIGNPSETETAYVSVYIAGEFKGSMSILPQGRWTPYYANVSAGPVQVKSTDVLETAGGQSSVAGIPVFASERMLYKTSMNETSGIPNNPGDPNNKLTVEYWFPWYDFLNMQTWISIGTP